MHEGKKMKRTNNSILIIALLIGVISMASTASKVAPISVDGAKTCTTIQSGQLLTSDDQVIVPGYDVWGYNYQAHIFNGGYCDAYRDAAWCQEYKDDELIMKWNDAWLSNMDCDGDGKLDRHYGFPTYIGSGAWETNHQSGEYEYEGKICKWNYFVKIVAKPSADYSCYAIWGEFCVIEEIYNDPCAGYHGLLYASPDHLGLGGW